MHHLWKLLPCIHPTEKEATTLENGTAIKYSSTLILAFLLSDVYLSVIVVEFKMAFYRLVGALE